RRALTVGPPPGHRTAAPRFGEVTGTIPVFQPTTSEVMTNISHSYVHFPSASFAQRARDDCLAAVGHLNVLNDDRLLATASELLKGQQSLLVHVHHARGRIPQPDLFNRRQWLI